MTTSVSVRKRLFFSTSGFFLFKKKSGLLISLKLLRWKCSLVEITSTFFHVTVNNTEVSSSQKKKKKKIEVSDSFMEHTRRNKKELGYTSRIVNRRLRDS